MRDSFAIRAVIIWRRLWIGEVGACRIDPVTPLLSFGRSAIYQELDLPRIDIVDSARPGGQMAEEHVVSTPNIHRSDCFAWTCNDVEKDGLMLRDRFRPADRLSQFVDGRAAPKERSSRRNDQLL